MPYRNDFNKAASFARTLIKSVIDEVINLPSPHDPKIVTAIADSLSSQIDYSPIMKEAVNVIAEDSADAVLADKTLQKLIQVWKPESSAHLRKVVISAQKAFEDAAKIRPPFQFFERKTEINFTSKDYSKEGDRTTIEIAGYKHIDNHRDYNRPSMTFIVKDVIELNTHPSSDVLSPYKWLSALFHENIHSLENIIRICGVYNQSQMAIDAVLPKNAPRGDKITTHKTHIDVALAMAIWSETNTLGIGETVPFEIYKASPSERLARLGQSIFENRIKQRTGLEF